MSICIEILRCKEVAALFGFSTSTLWNRINDGVVPPPIKLGGETSRASGWMRHEVRAILAAMAAGKSKVELTFLVHALVEDRSQMFDELGLRSIELGSESEP